MSLYDNPPADPEPRCLIKHLPALPGRLLPCEHAAGNDALLAAIGGEPDALARALSVSVFRLGPDQLRRVASFVVQELSA